MNALCRLLAGALKRLWSIDISDCPSDQRLSNKLLQAQYNIESGRVDLENVEPDPFGENGFRDPSQLLQWLHENSRIIIAESMAGRRCRNTQDMMNFVFCMEKLDIIQKSDIICNIAHRLKCLLQIICFNRSYEECV